MSPTPVSPSIASSSPSDALTVLGTIIIRNPGRSGEHGGAELAFLLLFLLVVVTRRHISRAASTHLFNHAPAVGGERAPLLPEAANGTAEGAEAGVRSALFPGLVASAIALGVSVFLMYDGLVHMSWVTRHLLSFWITHGAIGVLSAVLLARITSFPSSATTTLGTLGTLGAELGAIIFFTPLIAVATRDVYYNHTWFGIVDTFLLSNVVVPGCGATLVWWGSGLAARE